MRFQTTLQIGMFVMVVILAIFSVTRTIQLAKAREEIATLKAQLTETK